MQNSHCLLGLVGPGLVISIIKNVIQFCNFQNKILFLVAELKSNIAHPWLTSPQCMSVKITTIWSCFQVKKSFYRRVVLLTARLFCNIIPQDKANIYDMMIGALAQVSPYGWISDNGQNKRLFTEIKKYWQLTEMYMQILKTWIQTLPWAFDVHIDGWILLWALMFWGCSPPINLCDCIPKSTHVSPNVLQYSICHGHNNSLAKYVPFSSKF